MRMIPSRAVRAQEEWILPPTKYRLSKTLAGSAYQVSRSGAFAEFATYGGTASLESSPPLCGSRQTRTSVPRNSNPAAVFADCTAAWASASKSLLAGVCASALQAARIAATARVVRMGPSLLVRDSQLTPVVHYRIIIPRGVLEGFPRISSVQSVPLAALSPRYSPCF